MSLPLERLLQLPLGPEALLAVLEEFSATPQPAQAAIRLWGELAELRQRLCREAYEEGRWVEALAHHDGLLAVVTELTQVMPEEAEAVWERYGELISFFTAAAHESVIAETADLSNKLAKAELCWSMSRRLQRARELQVPCPDWAAVLEKYLVQDGASFWKDLIDSDEVPVETARRRTYELLLRLDQLLAPAPPWVHDQAKTVLSALIEAQLAEKSHAPAALAQLCVDLERFPLDQEVRDALVIPLTRVRLTLELMEPELAALGTASTTVSQPSSRVSREVDQPAGSVQHLAAELPPPAEMVLLAEGQEADALHLDLKPLLEAEFERIEEALNTFIWNLPQGSRALPAASALPTALESAWQGGLRLPAAAFERLSYLGAAWQRRFSERLEPLPQLDWQHSLLIELNPTELAVLAPLLATPASIEPVLNELRREHHNKAFWLKRQELRWMQCPPPLEAIRRLHVEEGYYAPVHEPLTALEGWGREVVQAILEGALWTDDAACLGLWLALGQELAARSTVPLPTLGAPPPPDLVLQGLAGLEVVYVGGQAAAVQTAHRAGRCFRGEPFGLRVLEPASSRWPARPRSGFEESLTMLLDALDALYRQRPFAVLLADCGAYTTPLMRAVHHRYGVSALSSGRPMARWLGG